MQFANQEKIFKYYLLALVVPGMAFAFLVTYRYGAGLSTDGARYLSSAENLIRGDIFAFHYDLADVMQICCLHKEKAVV